MCGYCENKKLIISSTKFLPDRIETVAGQIDGNKLKVSSLLQHVTAVHPPISADTVIMYCPMCGRKLTENED